ncbi:TPA: HlyD family efflux transporter periplasmic adaptor subunit [Candidatus Poribacteria bacterium]|nr:HlyD family efflux transporter periplasmic adaptor subunit [Candidatus Poribacteria bacterium]
MVRHFLIVNMKKLIMSQQIQKKLYDYDRLLFKIFLISTIIIFFSATISGCNRKKEEEDKMEVVRYGRFVVKIRETGNLEPLVSVAVRSNVEGEIEKILVREGDFVKKGQKLIRIDPQQIEEQKHQAEASRDARRASLDQAKIRIYLTEKQQDSTIVQSKNSVEVAQANLDSNQATSNQQIRQAQANISTTRNLLEQDHISLNQSEIALQQAGIQLEQHQSNSGSSKINYDNAKAEYNRNKELFQKKFISKKSLEDAKARYATAASQYESAQKNVESQIRTVESQRQNIDARNRAIENRKTTLKLEELNLESTKSTQEARQKQLEAELKNAQTRLQQILETTEQEKELTVHSEVGAQAALLESESRLKSQTERLEWTIMMAPISGKITKLSVEEGEIITSGRSAFSQGPAILTIADLSKMVVKTYINEVEIAKVKIDQKVEIHVDAYPQTSFQGIVSEIAPSADVQQRTSSGIVTFEVVIEVIGSPPQLMPGMSADIDIVITEKSDILQLPIESVIISEVLTIQANIPPMHLSKLQIDQEITIENLVGKQFKATVGKILPNKILGNAEILLDKSARGIRTGPTEIKIRFQNGDMLNGIETNIDSEKKYFVQLDDGTITKQAKKGKKGEIEEKGLRKRIEVGQRNNSHFEIISGVADGDRIFVPSMKQLTQQDGDRD